MFPALFFFSLKNPFALKLKAEQEQKTVHNHFNERLVPAEEVENCPYKSRRERNLHNAQHNVLYQSGHRWRSIFKHAVFVYDKVKQRGNDTRAHGCNEDVVARQYAAQKRREQSKQQNVYHKGRKRGQNKF